MRLNQAVMRPWSLLLGLLCAPAAGAMDVLQACDLAWQNDPQLAQVAAERRAVAENRPQAIARLLPTIGLTAGADDVNNNNKVGFQALGGKRNDSYWNLSLAVKMSQPIYHHDYWVQLGQADDVIAQAEADYQAAVQDSLLRTAAAYFQVLAQQDALQFAEAEKHAIARQLEQAQQHFEAGLIAIADVHEAQAAFDSATAAEISARNDWESAQEALREIIGAPVEALENLSDNRPLEKPEPADSAAWVNQALSGNPSVLSARNAVEAARKQVNLQRAGHYPTLDLVASHSVQDSSRDRPLTDLNGNPNGLWQKMGPRSEVDSVGLQLNVPFFQGGAVNSRTRQALAELEKTQHALDQQLRAAERSAKDAHRAVLSALARIQALKSAVRSAQTALQTAEAGLEVGLRTMVEVLQEQRDFYKAQSDYSRARYDYVVQGLTLKRAAGVLDRNDIEQVNAGLH